MNLVELFNYIRSDPLLWGIIAATVFLVYVFSIGGLSIWIERKWAGLLQSRLGPTRVGPFGILQFVADLIKLVSKEDFVPPDGDKKVFKLAPIVLVSTLIAAGSIIPFSPSLIGSNVNVGILFLIAMFSISPIAVFMAGWGSNNKFSLLGALRNIGQMLSFEIPLSLSIVAVVVMVGSLRIKEIVQAQDQIWFFALQPLGFVVFLLAIHAEAGRTPFDMQESEQELMGGWNVEYSGMRFGLTMVGEYIHLILGSMLVVLLYFGGWKSFGFLPPVIWFIIKTNIALVILMWSRWAIPRFRIDQIIDIGWKYLLPLSILNLLITGALVSMGWFSWI
ncbi:MAG: NADH dehydrogenase subunit H [Candidatus Methanohalarchaeum thermophilum]|uniref:NADH dehydrogenase subunit H n=1 Tax=Methanohalarchaeum thermophilum TaxID=1903181 RepID=A0A1Q6DX70_METT1|nr:MAG: NADH dehydrogenase subunit H [Candidatus Methanohalarchaeum thermophilum]